MMSGPTSNIPLSSTSAPTPNQMPSVSNFHPNASLMHQQTHQYAPYISEMHPHHPHMLNEDDYDDSYEGGAFLKEQDRLLPIANVARIMKMAVPANAKIAKDAKETVQECVSEFIAFVTSEASDRCQQEKRKTINGEDILWAMESLGFDNYVRLLKIYLQKYKEALKLDKDGSSPQMGGLQLLQQPHHSHPHLSRNVSMEEPSRLVHPSLSLFQHGNPRP